MLYDIYSDYLTIRLRARDYELRPHQLSPHRNRERVI